MSPKAGLEQKNNYGLFAFYVPNGMCFVYNSHNMEGYNVKRTLAGLLVASGDNKYGMQ
jgi:hypothetical protein